ALEAVSDALRIEVWNKNIKIITINPGVIETDIYDVLKTRIDDLINNNNNSSSNNNGYSRFIEASKEKIAIRLRPFIPDKLLSSLIAKQIHHE
ncbi:MAG: short-chainputative dehydrogenase, partial [Nitrososphaeraceae archaeon]|nr:short-chainputative dehydrogenase [Nitrososphaeraceae archaeon]